MATCRSKSKRQRITPASHRNGARLAAAVRCAVPLADVSGTATEHANP